MASRNTWTLVTQQQWRLLVDKMDTRTSAPGILIASRGSCSLTTEMTQHQRLLALMLEAARSVLCVAGQDFRNFSELRIRREQQPQIYLEVVWLEILGVLRPFTELPEDCVPKYPSARLVKPCRAKI